MLTLPLVICSTLLQIMALESAASNKEIFDVMRAGKDALKVATATTDVDKVADVMEDISEVSTRLDEQNLGTLNSVAHVCILPALLINSKSKWPMR
jgi:hypothetical protein